MKIKKSNLTLSKLSRMSLGKREAEFLKWVRGQEQNKETNYFKTEICPLAQFVTGRKCKGGFSEIFEEDENTIILKVIKDKMGAILCMAQYYFEITY